MSRRRPAETKLRVEPLENRLLLPILTVAGTSDSGPGSLRQAILEGNGNFGLDSIAFNVRGRDLHTI